MRVEFESVQARGLVKVFGATRALAGVDLDLRAGQVTVVAGHNGSGKSTLLSLLSLLSRPTRGSLRFGAHDAAQARARLRPRIGVLAHSAMLYGDLSALENLRIYADLYSVPWSRVREDLETFAVGGWCERPVRTYSRGQLQRVSLVRSLLHRPGLWLLDEPSTGLDVGATGLLMEAVRRQRDAGVIVLLVTHDRELGEALADVQIELTRGRATAQARSREQMA